MIPDFKTYIKESIWSDIQDRSTGNVVRKEDDINLLEPDDFITYIEKNYSMDNSPMEIINNKATSTIFIPFCTALRGVKIGMIFFDYDNMDIYTHNSIQIYIPRLWKKLNTFFDLSSNHFQEHYNTSIKPKDVSREITNSYVLEVLNFIIDNIDDDVNDDDVELCIFRKTNESIWSDIQDRSSGETVRKEDEINNLDISGLWDYINDNYKNLSHREAWVSKHDTGSFIHLPMFNRFGRLFGIYIKFNTDKLYAIQIEANKRICSEFISILEKDYEIDDNGGFGMVMIKSKTNEFTNTDVIHIIDLIIENSSEPALEKK